jgi:hypothetical protein
MINWNPPIDQQQRALFVQLKTAGLNRKLTKVLRQPVHHLEAIPGH